MNDVINTLHQESDTFDTCTNQVFFVRTRKLIFDALDAEFTAFMNQYANLKMVDSRQRVVRNGCHPQRMVSTPLGKIAVLVPRTKDRDIGNPGVRIRFKSSIIRPYVRETRAQTQSILWLYLKGLRTGDFSDALVSMVGRRALHLAPSAKELLQKKWTREVQAWNTRNFKSKSYVQFCIDSIHPELIPTEKGSCMLVVLGITNAGEKELITAVRGCSLSGLKWFSAWMELKQRGLEQQQASEIGSSILQFKCPRCQTLEQSEEPTPVPFE